VRNAAKKEEPAERKEMDLAGHRVLVLGLGVSGRSAAVFCAARGARVVAVLEVPSFQLESARSGRVETRRCSSPGDAVRTAAGVARKGEVVPLSPTCASFDRFEDCEDGGRQFRAAVEELSEGGAAS
jgi:UDP-N-acetylmuramoylalanine-D-glutamate ligase